jgi:STE24 endopeptidase
MIGFLVLCALVGYYLLDILAKVLNLRSLHTGVPPEFSDVYDEYRYGRSQQYSRANTWFEIVWSTCTLALLLGFWFLDGFQWLDETVHRLNLPSVATGLTYLAILAGARTLLDLPFQLYHTFVIEQNFGFNRTTLVTFISDRLKEWAISALLLGGLALFVLWLFHTFGTGVWVAAWLITALLMVIFVYVAPMLILPLFFKLSPVPSGELRERVTEFCASQRFPIRDLFVIDGSRRSAKANAFFTGFGHNKRIALYDTLISNHTIPELVAVLAHEVGHFKKHHVIQHFVFAQLNLLLLFFAASWCVSHPALFAAFGVETPSYHVGLVLFFILIKPVTMLLGILANFWSRVHEFEADRYAAESLGDPNPLIQALKKLSKDNLSNLTPHPLLVSLHFTHPPVLERVNALRAIGSELRV